MTMRYILLLITGITLIITGLYVKLSEERDRQTIGYSYLLYWQSMASSPEWLCRARGGEYKFKGVELTNLFTEYQTSSTTWMCIGDKH